ncbi:MAG: transglycosylase family protein, partial [Gammaproteobacteria bacterium]
MNTDSPNSSDPKRPTDPAKPPADSQQAPAEPPPAEKPSGDLPPTPPASNSLPPIPAANPPTAATLGQAAADLARQ